MQISRKKGKERDKETERERKSETERDIKNLFKVKDIVLFCKTVYYPMILKLMYSAILIHLLILHICHILSPENKRAANTRAPFIIGTSSLVISNCMGRHAEVR